MRENVDILEYFDDFLDTTLKIQSMKEIIGKLNFLKRKNFCSTKDISDNCYCKYTKNS